MRWLYAVVAAIFFTFALFQLNDPDAATWVSLYLFAAIVSIPPVFGRHTPFPAIGLGVYLVWFVTLADAVDEYWWHSEEAREALGLLIATFWMGVLLFAWTRQRHERARRQRRNRNGGSG
jgi:hypothetical protein